MDSRLTGNFINPRKLIQTKMKYNIIYNCQQNVQYAFSVLIYYTSIENIRKVGVNAQYEIKSAVETLIMCRHLECRGVIKSLVYFTEYLKMYLNKCTRLYPEDFSWMLTECIETNLTDSFDLLFNFYVNNRDLIRGQYNLDFLETFPRIYNDRGVMTYENRDIATFLKVELYDMKDKKFFYCYEELDRELDRELDKKYNDNDNNSNGNDVENKSNISFDLLSRSLNLVSKRIKELDEITLRPTFNPNIKLTKNELYIKAKIFGLIDYYYEEKLLLGSNENFNYSYYTLLGPFYFGYCDMTINNRIVEHFLEYSGSRLYELFFHWINYGYDISYRQFISRFTPELEGLSHVSILTKKKAICQIFRMYNPVVILDGNEVLIEKEYLEKFCNNYLYGAEVE